MHCVLICKQMYGIEDVTGDRMSTYRNGTGCQARPFPWVMIPLCIEEVSAIVPKQWNHKPNQKSGIHSTKESDQTPVSYHCISLE
jgi:hypothetical protein